jgi:transposase
VAAVPEYAAPCTWPPLWLPDITPQIQRFYEHLLRQGKKKLVALTACMRKLLLILNAMIKHNNPWNSQANTS